MSARQRSECLRDTIVTACLVLLGEAHLRLTFTEFVAHYHRERSHQGLHDRIIAPETLGPPDARVQCRTRLGELRRYYYRAA